MDIRDGHDICPLPANESSKYTLAGTIFHYMPLNKFAGRIVNGNHQCLFRSKSYI